MIKINIEIYSTDALQDATDISNELKDENLRGVSVQQKEAEPLRGELNAAEYLPIIQLLISSGFAAVAVKEIFSLLKNGFFTESKRIKAEKEVAMTKIKADKEVELAKLGFVELTLENEGQKHHFKITPENEEEQKKKILEMLLNADEKKSKT